MKRLVSGAISILLLTFVFSGMAVAGTLQTFVLTNVQPTQQGCSAPTPTNSFATASTIYIYFLVQGLNTGDVASIHWTNSSGIWTVTSGWGAIPGPGNWCFSGSIPATMLSSGSWTANLYMNSQFLGQTPFTINGTSPITTGTGAGPFFLTSLSRSQVGNGSSSIDLLGSGFPAGSKIAVCCNPAGSDVGVVQPNNSSTSDLNVSFYLADPGDFSVRVVAPDGRSSNTEDLLVGFTGYHMPFRGGTSVLVTQGNNDIFDHNVNVFPNVRWAYDLVSTGDRTVVAMRAGRVVAVHDGENNTCTPSFGNYVTIDHLDGEYSDYAHLVKGSLQVTVGENVVEGQPLGTMGNSGYAYSNTPCDGGGYHVHVQVTRTEEINGAQSQPFLFGEVNARNPDAPSPGQPVRGQTIISQNAGGSQTGNSGTSSNPGTSEADIAWNAILARARSDARFGSEVSGSQGYDSSWGGGSSPMRDLRYIDFNFTGGRIVRVFHAFFNNQTSNLGATTFYDFDKNAWAPWVNVQ